MRDLSRPRWVHESDQPKADPSDLARAFAAVFSHPSAAKVLDELARLANTPHSNDMTEPLKSMSIVARQRLVTRIHNLIEEGSK